MGVFRSDEVWESARGLPAPSIIVSMSPPSYPSAWLHPCRARFRFPWQNYCSASPSLTHNNSTRRGVFPYLADPELRQAGAADSAASVAFLRSTSRPYPRAGLWSPGLTHRFLQRGFLLHFYPIPRDRNSGDLSST